MDKYIYENPNYRLAYAQDIATGSKVLNELSALGVVGIQEQ